MSFEGWGFEDLREFADGGCLCCLLLRAPLLRCRSMYLCIQADEVHVRAGGCGGAPDCGIVTLDNDDLKTFSQTGFSASINPKTYRVFEHPYRMFFVLGNISRNKISMGDEKNMSRITLKVNVFKEGDVYVALCPMLNVSSFGDDIEHAKNSLKEALEAFLEECEAMGTLEAVLEETGFVKKKTMWLPEEPIMEEMIALSC